jgi:isopenicillin N synthase-like dioxygenase
LSRSVWVSFPSGVDGRADSVAFQTGEALQLLTGGKLAATPHFVSGNAATDKPDEVVSRETFAFFLQSVTLFERCPL